VFMDVTPRCAVCGHYFQLYCVYRKDPLQCCVY
jgi:hypothetical protein